MYPPLLDKSSDPDFSYRDANALRLATLLPYRVQDVLIYSSSETAIIVSLAAVSLRNRAGDMAVGDFGTAATYTTNLRCDRTAANPFVFSTTETIDGFSDGDLVELRDSAGGLIVSGYCEADSGVKTYGSDIVSNGDFSSGTTGWTSGNSAVLASVSGGYSGNCLQVTENGAANPYAQQIASGGTAYGCYEYTHKVKAGSYTPSWLWWYVYLDGVDYYDRLNSAAWYSFLYNFNLGNRTSIAIQLGHYGGAGSANNMLFDEVVCQRISSPGAGGLLLYSDAGLTTRGYVSTGAGDPDDAALLSLSSGIVSSRTLNLTTNGVGGIDKGEFSTGWHSIWVVGADSGKTGKIDRCEVIASKSFTDPVIPAGYTHRRLIGCFKSEEFERNIRVVPFIMQNGRFLFSVTQTAIADTGLIEDDGSIQELDLSDYIPPFVTIAYLRLYTYGGNAPFSLSAYVSFLGYSGFDKLTINGSTEDWTVTTGWFPCFSRKIQFSWELTNLVGYAFVVNGFTFNPGGGALR